MKLLRGFRNIYPEILLTAAAEVEISKTSRFGQENAMQARVVASNSLQINNQTRNIQSETKKKRQINNTSVS